MPYADPDLRANYEKALVVTNRRHDLVGVVLADDRELYWPDVGLVSLEDAETGRRVWVDSGDPQWQEHFKEQVRTFQQSRDAAMVRAQVDRITITVGEDYTEPLMAFFRTRAKRWRR